jgi:hypothetical protein
VAELGMDSKRMHTGKNCLGVSSSESFYHEWMTLCTQRISGSMALAFTAQELIRGNLGGYLFYTGNQISVVFFNVIACRSKSEAFLFFFLLLSL